MALCPLFYFDRNISEIQGSKFAERSKNRKAGFCTFGSMRVHQLAGINFAKSDFFHKFCLILGCV